MGLGRIVERACKFIAARVPNTVIKGDDGSPYLSRFYLFRRSWLPGVRPFNLLPSVYLHYFHRGDADVELHNHPWTLSVSLILLGGYHEERRVNGQIHSQIFRPGSFNVVRHTDFHRVDLLDPKKGSWTLFVAGVGGRIPEDDWGFWHPETKEYRPWREHVRLRDLRQQFAGCIRPLPPPGLLDIPANPTIHPTKIDWISLLKR
jgi:hypothetical protein